MNTFKTKNSLRTVEAQIVQKLKNNEARPKFTGSYKKKRVYDQGSESRVHCTSVTSSVYPAASTSENTTVPKPHQITQNNTKR